jgi:hypothetical protein
MVDSVFLVREIGSGGSLSVKLLCITYIIDHVSFLQHSAPKSGIMGLKIARVGGQASGKRIKTAGMEKNEAYKPNMAGLICEVS